MHAFSTNQIGNIFHFNDKNIQGLKFFKRVQENSYDTIVSFFELDYGEPYTVYIRYLNTLGTIYILFELANV